MLNIWLFVFLGFLVSTEAQGKNQNYPQFLFHLFLLCITNKRYTFDYNSRSGILKQGRTWCRTCILYYLPYKMKNSKPTYTIHYLFNQSHVCTYLTSNTGYYAIYKNIYLHIPSFFPFLNVRDKIEMHLICICCMLNVVCLMLYVRICIYIKCTSFFCLTLLKGRKKVKANNIRPAICT